MHTFRPEEIAATASATRILDLLDEVYYYLSVDGQLLQWNERLAEVAGYSHGEIEGMAATDFFDAADRADIVAAISSVVTENREATVVANLRTKAGESVPYEFIAKPIRGDGGDVQGVIGIGRDITARKRRKQELRELENAVEHAGHAVIVTDREGTIEYVNPAFEEMTGYSYDEAVGASSRLLKSGEHDESFYDELWETILGGDIWKDEVINRRKSGERFIVNQTIAPIRGADDTIQGFVAIQDEITSRRLREQQLEVFHRVLRHNLRNKGSAIVGQAELLLQALDDDQSRDRLRTIQKHVESLTEISEKARDVRRVLTHVTDRKTSRELEPVLERITDRVASEYPDAEVSVENDLGHPVAVDARSIPAFQELIENAIKHTETEPVRVTVAVTADSRTATVTIADNGPGIPEQERRAIEDGAEEPLAHSSGLGLWVSYWLVAYVGGNLDIQVNEDGSTVTVSIPYTHRRE